MGVGIAEPWRAVLFGGLRLERGGEVVDRFESRRTAALLAYLILYPGRHPREVLCDRIWPEAAPDSGRARLRQSLASLRRLLEPPAVAPGLVIEASRLEVGLRPGSVESDWQDFMDGLLERPARELLPGLYDEWLDEPRLRAGAHTGSHVRGAPAPPSPSKSFRLPSELTPFFGREEEIEDLLGLLREARLVVVTGIGGTGKSRVTLAAARRWEGQGAGWASLAGADSPERALAALAQALPDRAADPIRTGEDFGRRVGPDPYLVVLDNAEDSLGPWLAPILTGALQASEGLRFLASSRIPLGVEAEADYPLQPLPVPDLDASLMGLSESPSARLFVNRARRSRPDFQVTEVNREAMTEVLRRLDGLPLALELCAGWAQIMSPAQMALRLREGRDLLTDRGRTLPSRQRSLEAAFSTSFSLLSPCQRELMLALVWLPGGWTLETVARLFPGPLLESDLAALVQSAFVRRSGERFSIVEGLRSFLQKESTRREEAADRVLDAWTAWTPLVEDMKCDPSLGIRRWMDWPQFLSAEWDNIAMAIKRSIETGRREAGARLLLSLEWWWTLKGREGEALSLLDQIEPDTLGEPETRARLAAARPLLLWARGERESAEDAMRALPADCPWTRLTRQRIRGNLLQWEGLEDEAAQLDLEFTRKGRPLSAGLAWFFCAYALLRQMRWDEGEVCRTRAQVRFDEVGHPYWRSLLIHEEAVTHNLRQRFEEGGKVLDEGLILVRELGDLRQEAKMENLYGAMLVIARRESEGVAHLLRAVEIGVELRDRSFLTNPLWNYALALENRESWLDCVRCLSCAEKLWEDATASALPPHEQEGKAEAFKSATAACGEDAGEEAAKEGRGLTLEGIVRLAARLTADLTR